MRLHNKVAIITGAASGIGAGTAEVFAEQGARLVLVDRDGEGLAAVVAALPLAAGDAVTYQGDVAEAETARGAERVAREAFGGADILFNNAGVMTSGDFREFDEAAWDGVLDVNLRGIYLMCRAVLPVMLERGRGAIVNTSSVMAFLTEPGYEAYTTSKAGIVGLTKALAVSYATRGIRVNCVCPGWIDTCNDTQIGMPNSVVHFRYGLDRVDNDPQAAKLVGDPRLERYAVRRMPCTTENYVGIGACLPTHCQN